MQNTFMIQDADNKEVLFEVPTDMIGGWVFGINLANSSEGVILFSKKLVDGQFKVLENVIGSLQQEYNSSNFFENSSESDMY